MGGVGGFASGFSDAFAKSLAQGDRLRESEFDRAVALSKLAHLTRKDQANAALVESVFGPDAVGPSGGAGQLYPAPVPPGVTPPTSSLAPTGGSLSPDARAFAGIPSGPALAPDQAFGLEESGVPLTPPPAPSAPLTPPRPVAASAPSPLAAPRPRRSIREVIAGLPPQVRGQLDFETIKGAQAWLDEQQKSENKVEAQQQRDEGDAKLAAGDIHGARVAYSRSFWLLGDSAHANEQTEKRIAQISDEKTTKKIGGWALEATQAKAKYDNDPSPENYDAWAKVVAAVPDKTAHDFQGKFLEQMSTAADKVMPPGASNFLKTVSAFQVAGMNAGAPDTTKAWKAAIAQDPAGYAALQFYSFTRGKDLPAEVRTNIERLPGEFSFKDLTGSERGAALAQASQENPGLSPADPKVMTRARQILVDQYRQKERIQAEERVKATSAIDKNPEKLRIAHVAAQGATRAARRELEAAKRDGMQESDPEFQHLQDRLRQAEADEEHLATSRRELGALPPASGPVERVPKTPAATGAGTLKPSDRRYQTKAKTEFDAELTSGKTPDRAADGLIAKGWDRVTVDTLRLAAPKPGAPEEPAAIVVTPPPSGRGAPAPGSVPYTTSARTEITRLRAAGWTPDAIKSEMRARGWDLRLGQ